MTKSAENVEFVHIYKRSAEEDKQKKRCVRTFFVSYSRKPFDNFSKFRFVVRTGECRKKMWKKAIMYVPPMQNHLHKNGRQCRNCSFVWSTSEIIQNKKWSLWISFYYNHAKMYCKLRSFLNYFGFA